MKLKVIGFHDKCAQLAAEKKGTVVLEKQLEDYCKKLKKANKTIKELQAENKRLKADASKSKVDTPKHKLDTPKSKVDSPKKKKNRKSATAETKSTHALDLPAPIQHRPTMTVPMSAIAIASLPDNIIDASVSIMRSTDEEDWPERAGQ
jgi:hypothetical protein